MKILVRVKARENLVSTTIRLPEGVNDRIEEEIKRLAENSNKYISKQRVIEAIIQYVVQDKDFGMKLRYDE